MRPPAAIKHGTYGGYQVEGRRGLPHCADCIAANREYRAQWRAAKFGGGLSPNELRYAKVRSRALAELARRHPEEMAQIMAETYEATR